MEPNRRTMITSAGAVGTAAVVGLTSACSPDDSESGSGSSASAPPDATVPASDVPVGSGIVVDEAYVVTQPKEGEFHAFSSVCTHQGCQVRTVTETEIVCPCHSSRYSATSGEVLSGPATEALATYQVTDSDGTLNLSAQ